MEGKRTRAKKDVQESLQEKTWKSRDIRREGAASRRCRSQNRRTNLISSPSQSRHRHFDALLVDDRGHAETTWFGIFAHR